jgi:hypothetical protein
MTKRIFGKLFGYKGYLSKSLFGVLFQDGLQLFIKVRKKMRTPSQNQIMTLKDKTLLRKRVIIATVNDELKNLRQIEHSRHRSINGFLFNILSA